MGFEELLKKKLGPMRELVRRDGRPEPPAHDPATLWYRRAVGLELRVRPEETWAEVEVGRADRPDRERTRLSMREGLFVAGLTRWAHASELERVHAIRAADLWRFVDRDLLFFSTDDPGVHLTGRSGAIAEARATGAKLARRASVWPTCAVETAIQIAPMPFMPRGDDLRGAELVGVRFASLERGKEVFGATITGSKTLGLLLRELLPLLDGTWSPDELLDAMPKRDRDDVEQLLTLLDGLTFFDIVRERPEPAARLARPAGPQLTWLGHAAVLVQTAGKNVLVDPLFFSKSEPEARWTDPRSKFDPRALPPLDAILITHGDNDHLNANALALLPREVPVFIPKIGKPPAYQVDIQGVLRVLGFREVYEVEPWAAIALGDVVITACPFVGEDWGLSLAQSTFLVESDELSVFFAADAYRMDDVYTTLAARSRRVDVAFMGVSGNAETFVMPDGFGYGNFYRDWVPRVRHNEWVRHCAGPADAVASLAVLRPRFAFGYASGGAPYIHTEYSDTGDHAQLATLLAPATARGAFDTRAVSFALGVPATLAELPGLPRGDE
ncbi:MBL fold metallo-hydrolase [Myxococcota bacterium]|nr:MBL fold metallo-hydrolase [Myxococcota bacterium]